MLITGLSFSLGESERMLIVGESGAGKSSLLRAMAGLWTTGRIALLQICRLRRVFPARLRILADAEKVDGNRE